MLLRLWNYFDKTEKKISSENKKKKTPTTNREASTWLEGEGWREEKNRGVPKINYVVVLMDSIPIGYSKSSDVIHLCTQRIIIHKFRLNGSVHISIAIVNHFVVWVFCSLDFLQFFLRFSFLIFLFSTFCLVVVVRFLLPFVWCSHSFSAGKVMGPNDFFASLCPFDIKARILCKIERRFSYR